MELEACPETLPSEIRNTPNHKTLNGFASKPLPTELRTRLDARSVLNKLQPN